MMDSRVKDFLRIGIFYDGYYFYKVSNYYKYEHERKSRISITGLHEFIRHEIAGLTGIKDKRFCQIIDAHYFKGRPYARDLGEKVQSERVFDDILMRENIVSHYLPLRYNGDSSSMQEKGIDVWLALEAYELAIYKKFDILVLVAGDGDYVPLVRKLTTLGTQVMLISWDFSYYNENGVITETKTSRQLLEEVFYPISMHEYINNNDNEIIDNLFVLEKPIAAPRIIPKNDQQKTASENTDEEQYSTICSLRDGFGFIRDDRNNNIFFHYSTLTNIDFDELTTGMKVKYYTEGDAERSKKEEAPRYRACKVTVMDE
ncbi:cold shock protein [Treponema primitia ZAS-2]|uniref:Cold shock protein n=1 Tax=Treponema primitia (strain ATCC BAA-887 / DSM 12427 / ZAS-2) TaxID=545694 RepID=F5YJN6_TREPZ|nr:NYN domain-containing protein [Treponema primitia]AEF86111.1 cold shock protein [Treponema primitia ZAS-2]